FGLLAQTLRRTIGIRAGDRVATSREKLRARISVGVAPPDQDRVAAFLGELAGLPPEEAENVQLRIARDNPVLMGDQIQRAWEEFLAAECSRVPVLLVLEDLHWGDLPTVRLIDSALRNLADQPFFVLALARPEVHQLFPSLWAERAPTEIRMGELSRKAS